MPRLDPHATTADMNSTEAIGRIGPENASDLPLHALSPCFHEPETVWSVANQELERGAAHEILTPCLLRHAPQRPQFLVPSGVMMK